MTACTFQSIRVWYSMLFYRDVEFQCFLCVHSETVMFGRLPSTICLCVSFLLCVFVVNTSYFSGNSVVVGVYVCTLCQ